jgi:hypothetical protein
LSKPGHGFFLIYQTDAVGLLLAEAILVEHIFEVGVVDDQLGLIFLVVVHKFVFFVTFLADFAPHLMKNTYIYASVPFFKIYFPVMLSPIGKISSKTM